MSAPLLQIQELSIRLPHRGGGMRPVLERVSFELAHGEIVGLVGESGSGKSMTARSIPQLLPPGAVHEGDVLFQGHSTFAMHGRALLELRDRGVQMIFQDPRAHINPVRTIGDFITETLRANRGQSRAEADRRAAEILTRVGFANASGRLRQYPHQLSGGLLQRVMIAAAILSEPQLLIADEPTTALDVTTQAEVVALLEQLRRESGVTMLFITHDLELAAAVCDRIMVMYAGSIVEEHSATTMHRDPLHPYTAGLLAARPDVMRKIPRLFNIPGTPAAAGEVSRGCPFAPRCKYAQPACERERPPLRAVRGGRVACIRAEELAGELAHTAVQGVA
jgi:oligopeptide/dipeptide ABC transporter ATP-binding protein